MIYGLYTEYIITTLEEKPFEHFTPFGCTFDTQMSKYEFTGVKVKKSLAQNVFRKAVISCLFPESVHLSF